MRSKVFALSLIALVLGLFGAHSLIKSRLTARETIMLEQTPPIGQFVRVGRANVHAYIAGKGPDLVLIHGASGSLRDFTFDLVKRLAQDYRVVAFDRPGLGYSDALPNGDVSLAGQARQLRAAANAIGVSPNPLVLGHSYGGSVALAWAIQSPPSALILVGAPTLPWPGKLGWWYRLTSRDIPRKLAVPVAAAFVPQSYVDSTIAAIFAPEPPPEGYGAYVGTYLSLRADILGTNTRQVNELRTQLKKMAPLYPTLDMPVELIHGEADPIVGYEIHAVPTAKLLPNVVLTAIPNAGHMPHHTHTDVVLEAIDRAYQRTQDDEIRHVQ